MRKPNGKGSGSQGESPFRAPGYRCLEKSGPTEPDALGEQIGTGRTADVHRWGDDKILKLYQPWVSRGAVERERRYTMAARGLGVSVPTVGEIVTIGGQIGMIFEWVQGVSMMEEINRAWSGIDALAEQLADLHLTLHQGEAPSSLPQQADLLRAKIQEAPLLTWAEREAALDALAGMPLGGKLCHGDFHPGNIIVTDRGPVIIDWVDASRGDPVVDVARTSLLFRGHSETSQVPDEVRASMLLYHESYVNRYFRGNPDGKSLLPRWVPILAAARLTERIEEQNSWLLSLARTAGR